MVAFFLSLAPEVLRRNEQPTVDETERFKGSKAHYTLPSRHTTKNDNTSTKKAKINNRSTPSQQETPQA